MNRHLPKAFTLIELLVVISIISLLISILLPALGQARKSALAVRCLANVRQHGQLMQMYAQDNKGLFIAPIGTAGTASSTWTARLNTLGYLSTTNIAYCPSFNPQLYESSGASRSYGLRSPHSSLAVMPPGGTLPEHRLLRQEAVLSASEYPFIADTYRLMGSGPTQWSNFYAHQIAVPSATGPQLHAIHAGAVNMAFADGHGSAVNNEALSDPTNPAANRYTVHLSDN